MALIHGVPMIGHVYMRSKLATTLSDLYAATCDKEIYDYIVSIGGKAIMTSPTHPGCVDRCCEALCEVEKNTHQHIDIVVVIQGDEPLVRPGMIDAAVAPLIHDHTIQTSNLMGKITSQEEAEDINEIKVVCDQEGNALYFSREPIPCTKKGDETTQRWKQICIMPMRRDLLLWYGKAERTPLEIIESIDMLRLLEHGIPVRMVPAEHPMKSVDTPADLEKVTALMRDDSIYLETIH